MKRTFEPRKDFMKPLLASALIIGASTLVFQGVAQVALAEETGKPESIPTSYHAPVDVSSSQTGTTPPVGYEKADYTLVDNELEYYKDKKPSDRDLSREEAAEFGVQALWSVFGLDMSGKEIEMGFNTAQNGYRATWEGVWWVNGKKKNPDDYVQSYSFQVDSLTGEVYNVIHDRVLSKNADTNFNNGLHQNTGEYEPLARETAEHLGLVGGAVKTVEYSGQGYSNNDPDIFFTLTGTNGQRAHLRFSRYDKELLAVTYDAGVREMDVAIRNAEDFASRAEEYFLKNPGTTTYEE